MTEISRTRKQQSASAFDIPDQILFFATFAVGAASIWILKWLQFSQFVVTVAPVCLMVLYAGTALWTKRYRIREDKIGDNVYYLGFLYTLSSLSYALWVYNPDGSGATDIITNFGIAIFTTILGLAGRVFFNQMREDPIEYEREARQSLGEATNELRAHLADICIETSNFKRKTLQIMEEGAADVTNTVRATLAENVERFAATSSDVIEKIQAAFSSFTDHSTRLNEIASKNAEALQSLFERIERIEASPEMLASKLDPVIQKFAEVADEAMRRNRAQTNDLKRVRDAIEVVVNAAEALQAAAGASGKGVTDSLEQYAERLQEGIGAVAQFRDVMVAATEGLSNEVEAGRKMASAVADGMETHKTAVAEIRAAIEGDLRITREHREAAAKMLEESRSAVVEVERALVSMSRTLAEQLGGR